MPVFLETERLILRYLTSEDTERLYALDHDPEVMRFINGGQPTPYGDIHDRLERWLRLCDQYPGYGFWAADSRSEGEFLGWFHFRPAATNPDVIELGYRLHRAAWGHGYAVEGARALVLHGFTRLDTQRVMAHTLLDNVRSRRVLEKVGLKYVQVFRYVAPGMWHDGLEAVEYGVAKDDWLRDHTASWASKR